MYFIEDNDSATSSSSSFNSQGINSDSVNSSNSGSTSKYVLSMINELFCNFVCFSQKSVRRGCNGKIPQFMEGIPGVHVFTEQPKAFQLQKMVRVMCEWERYLLLFL